MSQRSKYSKYNARGKSLGVQRDGYKPLDKIPEQEELNFNDIHPKCHVCENDLTHEEHAFNEQIISYRQNKEKGSKDYERQQDSDKISELGNNIIKNNNKMSEQPNGTGLEFAPLLCAQCMYELYMAKGIVPQMKDAAKDGTKQRSHSDSRGGRALTNEELNRKIQKEMIIAKHLGDSHIETITKKPHLMSVAQKTFGGYDFKPSMLPKQNNLKSSFADLTRATDLIDNPKVDLSKTLSLSSQFQRLEKSMDGLHSKI